MPASVLAAAMICLSATAADNGPVRTYTRTPDPSRSEGLRTTRQFIPDGDPPNAPLLTPAPYPATKTDGPDRVEHGRIWMPRSPVGNRTPVREQPRGFPGPGSFGAPVDAHDDVIFVKTPEIRAVVGISPWVRVDSLDEQIEDFINTQEPFYGASRRLTRLQGPRILSQLQAAQNLWLQQQGYILNVRTHVSPGTLRTADSDRAEAPKPRAVIRVIPDGQPTKPASDPRHQAAAEPDEPSVAMQPVSSPETPE